MTSLPSLPQEPRRDPAELGWPPALPVEVAMQMTPISEICEGYGLSHTQWLEIKSNPGFIVEVSAAVEALKKEGAGFRTRARIQAVELLKESWRMIHDQEAPPSVRADLIKFTIKAAGLDGSRDQIAAGAVQNAFQINIDLSRS